MSGDTVNFLLVAAFSFVAGYQACGLLAVSRQKGTSPRPSGPVVPGAAAAAAPGQGEPVNLLAQLLSQHLALVHQERTQSPALSGSVKTELSKLAAELRAELLAKIAGPSPAAAKPLPAESGGVI